MITDKKVSNFTKYSSKPFLIAGLGVNFFDPTYLPVFQTDFDAVRVLRRLGKDVFNGPFCKLAGPLIFLQDDGDFETRSDVFAVSSVHAFTLPHPKGKG
jgi:hypothetical protein